METQIWVKTEDKWAYILLLQGQEVHILKITGNMLNLKGRLQSALEGLEQGKAPCDVGAKSVETLDLSTMSKAEIAPGNGFLTLFGEGDPPQKLTFVPAEDIADQIFQAILAQSGQNFQPTQEEVGVVEAMIPPSLIGGVAGFFWFLVYMTATEIASGKVVEAKGRRKGVQQILIWVADMLGTTGTIVVGVLLFVLIGGWAARRIVKRPERTVWLPEKD